MRRRTRTPDRTERRIAAGLRRGDRRALEAIWAEHEPTVLGYLVNVLGDRSRAEDVNQQVLLEVWQRGGEFDPRRAGLLTWIMVIARSRAVDELRRRVPEPRNPALVPDLAADDRDSPEALVERWMIAHLLGRLRRDDAELLRLRFYDDLSQTEIAARLELPLGTVKTRMVAAMRQLRDLIEQESPGTELDAGAGQAHPVAREAKA